MTSRDFVYWLQGYFELAENPGMSADQVEVVKRHLALVFKHEIDPSYGDEKHQAKLNDIHDYSENAHPFLAKRPTPPEGVKYRC